MAVGTEDRSKAWIPLLVAVIAAGVGTEFALLKPVPNALTIQVGDTGLTSGILFIEGSLDGVLWFSLAEHTFTAAEIAANEAMFHIVNKPTNHIRANLTAYNGTALTVKAIAGRER